MTSIEGFEEEGRERVIDGFRTALHKRRDFSLGHFRFCKPEYFSNLYVGKVHALGPGLGGGSLMVVGGVGECCGGKTRNFKNHCGVSVHVADIVDACNDKVRMHGCKGSEGKRKWLEIKYTSSYAFINISVAMRHRDPDSNKPREMQPALFRCKNPLQQFPLDEENPIILYFRYLSPTIFAHSEFRRKMWLVILSSLSDFGS
jgi:hypothetical protein